MKNRSSVKIRGPLEPWAIEVIQGAPGLDDAAAAAAAILVSEGGQAEVLLESKRYVDVGAAHAIAARHDTGRGEPPVVVIAERSTEGAREVLARHGINYVDGLGNASIRTRAVVVRTGSFTADAAIAPKPKVPARLSGRAGLVAQAMLLHPNRSWQISELASHTGVSAGLAHRVVARLEGIGLLSSSGRGPKKVRSLENAEGLLDLWAEEDREPRLRRHAGYVLSGHGKSPAKMTSIALAKDDIDHAVTGVAAAALYEPTLTAIPVTEVRVSSRASINDAWHVLRGRQVDQGANVVLLQADGDDELRFRERRDNLWVAARTRIYLDASRDPRRGQEQAEAFRPHVLTGS